MALYVCLDCTAAYPTDMEKCPQCGSKRTRFDYEEPQDAKPLATGGVITAHQPVIAIGDDTPPSTIPPGAKASPAGPVTVNLPDAKAGA